MLESGKVFSYGWGNNTFSPQVMFLTLFLSKMHGVNRMVRSTEFPLKKKKKKKKNVKLRKSTVGHGILF